MTWQRRVSGFAAESGLGQGQTADSRDESLTKRAVKRGDSITSAAWAFTIRPGR